MLAAAVASGCAHSRAPVIASATPFPKIAYATWRDDEPAYCLYPGDQIDVSIPSAPELNRSVVVQPDGRLALPLIGTVMAADRSGPELEGVLKQAYTAQLRDPRVEIAVRAATPLRIFVGGEVAKPGVYDMPGDSDALRAIVMGGGVLASADRRRVVVIRRDADGRAMMRMFDLDRSLKNASVDLVPLRRFDVIYVPRSGISNIGLFVQQYIRDVIPVTFSYGVGANGYLSTTR